MIAYRPYSQCPAGVIPRGIPLAYPWYTEQCEVGDTSRLEAAGFTVLSDDEYASLLASLSEELTSWQATYAVSQQVEAIKAFVLQPAKQFGLDIVDRFAAENIALGITQAGLTNSVRKATAQVIAALSTGSLYDAIYEARQIPAEAKDLVYLTDARLLAFVNRIEDYLGITRSVSL